MKIDILPCLLTDFIHLFLSVVDAAAYFGEVHKNGYLVTVDGAVFHFSGKSVHGLITRVFQGVDDGKGQFSLCHVIAGGFANFF